MDFRSKHLVGPSSKQHNKPVIKEGRASKKRYRERERERETERGSIKAVVSSRKFIQQRLFDIGDKQDHQGRKNIKEISKYLLLSRLSNLPVSLTL